MPFKPINVSLSPNTEADDARLALKLAFQPLRWVKGDAADKLEEKFREWFGINHALAFRTGRGAFYATLRALDLKSNDEILIQAYTCAALPNSINWAGVKPVYVDIDETLNMSPLDLEKKITPRSRVIVVQHTFGIPAKLDKIMDVAKKHNLILIEDCAHALGAKYNGRYVGTSGDISFFSFGKDKVISGTFGGMLIASNTELAKKIGAIRAESKVATRSWVLKQLLHPAIMFYLVLPIYNLFNIGKFILAGLKTTGLISRAVTLDERQGRKSEKMLGAMPNALAVLILNQLKKINYLNEHRRTLAHIYDGGLSLSKDGSKLPQVPGGSEPIYFRYNLRIENRDKILLAARRKNILLDDLFNPVIAPEGTSLEKMGYVIGSCPEAEKASKEALNLPTNINTSIENARKVIELLKNFKV